MADKSKIEWTDATWNPIAGCTIVSPGCTNCYAMRDAHRLANNPNPKVSEKYAGTTVLAANGKPVWTGMVHLAGAETLAAPLRWARPRRIFVNAMSDLFHEAAADDWIDRIFAVMALCPQHTFQVLTKRPERMRAYLRSDGLLERVGAHQRSIWDGYVSAYEDVSCDAIWPLPNVWLGVSCEDQRRANERVPVLLDTPAAIRWVSAEPLLGPINFRRIRIAPDHHTIVDALDGYAMVDTPGRGVERTMLDWIVAGGESGPGARPMHPDWVRRIRDDCAAAGVAFSFKQWGAWSPVTLAEDEKGDLGAAYPMDGCTLPSTHKAEQECLFWQADRLVHWPLIETASAVGVRNVGKKAAGRLLDGHLHDAFPEARRG